MTVYFLLKLIAPVQWISSTLLYSRITRAETLALNIAIYISFDRLCIFCYPTEHAQFTRHYQPYGCVSHMDDGTEQSRDNIFKNDNIFN